MTKQKKAASSLTLDEIKSQIKELQNEMFKLRMQKVTGQLTNTAAIRLARKQVARLRTAETQKTSADQMKG